ncbi:hypothetical protein Sango_0021100 [Sesamum angolense]|uniref:Uncharacterized protein n=1 Tax=Sesamum angolense TaxID=2727404 RepID=A0AAE1XCM0_9LAMI|nr:hypothetical protein Sango_0021100 [Sesamum angolense]
MLEWIMEYLMQRLQQNRDRAKKRWKKVLCPKIQTIIDRNIEKLEDCIPIKSDDKHYQISCFDGTQYSVDLENATCGCRKWDLSEHAILPINGRKKWKKSNFVPPVPPNHVKKVGRPRKTRRLEPDEPVQKKKKRKPAPIFKEGSNKIKRQQTTVKCGKCGVQGRNARTCQGLVIDVVTDATSQAN